MSHDHDDAPPRCDLKWAAGCDGIGVFQDAGGPEWFCPACFSVCVACQAEEWVEQVAGDRLCGACLTARQAKGAA